MRDVSVVDYTINSLRTEPTGGGEAYLKDVLYRQVLNEERDL